MESKYNINFSKEEIEITVRRLTNQLWKLIPMKEHEEDWTKQIDTVIIEIVGLNEVFNNKFIVLLQILSKLEGLKLTENIQFNIYRKTVFESISLLQELIKID